jgi:hypothetical protein
VCIPFARFLSFSLTACLVGLEYGGLGWHALYIEYHYPEKLLFWLKDLFAMSVVYLTGVNIPKFAILVLYWRLFPTKVVRTCVYLLMGALGLSSFILIVTALAACHPMSANWNPAPPAGACINKEPLYLWSAFPNFITDLAMLILPLPIIWKLHTKTEAKVGLTLTFLVGSA